MHVLFKANLYVVLIFDANGEAFIDMTLREIATVVIVKFIFNSIQFNSHRGESDIYHSNI